MDTNVKLLRYNTVRPLLFWWVPETAVVHTKIDFYYDMYIYGMLLTYIFAKLFLTGISKSIKEVCILQIKVDFESR